MEEISPLMGSKTESKIFDVYKTLGLVSNHVPCVLRYIHNRRQNFVVTCSGKSFNTYVGQQLKLRDVSEFASDDINCLATDTYQVYTAVSNKIYAWRRGTELQHTYKGGHDSDINFLLPFGENLLSLDAEGCFCMRNIQTEEIIRTFKFNKSSFNPTVLMHPLSYTNKVLFGSSEGLIQLWNINTVKLIHHFDAFSGSRINAIVQTPSQGTVAVALSNKKIALFNFVFNQTAMVLDCLDVPVSIAFRTDDTNVMISGSSTGSITAWDLNKKEIICYEKDAHQLAVSGLVTFMSEPIMVSSSSDNSIKVWIFDKPDGGFRLLNCRAGHISNPKKIQFVGENDLNIISLGDDFTLRTFHMHNETYNRTISNYVPLSDDEKGRGVKISWFTNSIKSHRALAEDIVCIGDDLNELYTFSFENSKRGKNLIVPEKKLRPSIIHLTVDNEWVVVGCTTGELFVFNLQSKILRRKYGIQNNNNKAHRGEIFGLAVDMSNSVMVSGGIDKVLRFWDFRKQTFINELRCNGTVAGIFSNPHSNLFGVRLSNGNILVCDLVTRFVVRTLEGPDQGQCGCFSPDMKWVTVSFTDGCVRTWDVPTGNLIDVFRLFDGIITSLDYSPNGDFLATTVSNQVGILLWINKSVYEHVSLMPLPSDYLPTGVESTVEPVESSSSGDLNLEKDLNLNFGPGELPGFKLSLGKVYNYRWTDLLNLEEIRDRNKPLVPNLNEARCPFLLNEPLSQSAIVFQWLNDSGRNQGVVNSPETSSRIVDLKSLTPFALKLSNSQLSQDFHLANDCKELIQILELMGPSQLDTEIRSLGPDAGGSIELLKQFIRFMALMANCTEHFQTSQLVLALFLKVFTEVLASDKSLRILLTKVYERIEVTRNQFESLSSRIIGMANFAAKDLF